MRLNAIPLVHLKVVRVTLLDIILFNRQVLHITYRKKTCHAFDNPVIIPEGELVCQAKFMTPMIKTSYWHHNQDEAIPVVDKLKQVLMPYIELIQKTIQQIIFHNILKDTLIGNLIYYLNMIIKSYWIQLNQEKILTMMNMRKMKITTM